MATLTNPTVPVGTLMERAQRQHGVFTVTDAQSLGVSRGRLRGLARRGEIQQVHRGVYRVTAAAWDQKPRLTAAVLAGGAHAVASHSSVAWLLGISGTGHGSPEITLPFGRDPDLTGVRVHRSRGFSADDVHPTAGIPCTSPARTVIDLAGRLSRADALRLVDTMVWNEHCSRAHLHERAAALRHGRRGVSTVADATAPGAEAAFRSQLERDFGALIADTGIQLPQVNAPIDCHGRRYVADNLWAEAMLIVELIGLRFHDGPNLISRDAERTNDLISLGYRVLAFTWHHIHSDPDGVVRRVCAALR